MSETSTSSVTITPSTLWGYAILIKTEKHYLYEQLLHKVPHGKDI